MSVIERPGVRTAVLVVLLVTLLAGDGWRYTIGWAGFGVVVALLAAASVVLLVSRRASWRIGALPYPLIAFVLLAATSTIWSFYPGATALGVAASVVTITAALAVSVAYSWRHILRGLGIALRLILGLSLLFEFVVAVFVRAPVLPPIPQPGIDYGALPDPVPKMLFWSRNELFEVFDGGKIQGIVGNSALLAFVALLGIIVFAIQLLGGTVRRRWGVLWLVVAIANFVFANSATNIIALVVVIVVGVALLLIRHAQTPRARITTYLGLGAVAAVGVLGAVLLRGPLLGLLGKTDTLTGRLGIWEAVIALAQQRPAAGWGWVGYWVPWVAPFDTLAFRNGVRQLHAHNAWIDLWFQLGVLGLIVFGALLLSTLIRSWAFAVDRPQSGPEGARPYSATTLLPVLIVVALIVQSLAESRLLVEYGLFLLALVAVKTKADQRAGVL
jgi:hypothetical protein